VSRGMDGCQILGGSTKGLSGRPIHGLAPLGMTRTLVRNLTEYILIV
jgi:hypothetical protein